MPRARFTVCCLSLCLVLGGMVPLSQAAQENAGPTSIEDPHYGEVLFYFYQEDFFPAIVRLLAAQEQAQFDDHAEQAELLLGGLYLSYGHHLRAAEIFERMLADNVAPDIRDRTWFFLAKIWYQRGYHDKAQEALSSIENELPQNLQREALLFPDRLLQMAVGRRAQPGTKALRRSRATEWDCRVAPRSYFGLLYCSHWLRPCTAMFGASSCKRI